MSKFLTNKLENIKPYVPGEQPNRFEKKIKLNTNESPFPPSLCVDKVLKDYYHADLRLYPNPSCDGLISRLSATFDVDKDMVTVGNGSDELLAFCFMGFCENGAAFPDLTYGFYKVFSGLFDVNYEEIELNSSLEIDVKDYKNLKNTVVIANPNAPTGIELSQKDIEKLLKQDEKRLVIVDEAYVDFGGKSSVELVKKYDNLLVIGTFSKSRNLAGARIGFAIGNKEIIDDLNKIKFSFNPYNINSLSLAIGEASLSDESYFKRCMDKIKANRKYITKELEKSGFQVVPGKANFIFVKCKNIPAETYYKKLKERDILIRYFDIDRIKDYVRITVGSESELKKLIEVTKEILK